MKHRSIAVALLVAAPLAAQAAPETYRLDPRHTFTYFSVEHFGLSNQFGRFDKNTGRITLDRAAHAATLDVTVDAARHWVPIYLVRGEGGFKGPDLSVIGAQRSAEHLRQAIVDPDAEVLRDYWVAKITMENGAAYSGFLLTQGAYTVEILDFAKGLKSLPTHDFRKFEIEKSSAMPSFRGRLSDGEVDDLVAYLWSLKRQGRSE